MKVFCASVATETNTFSPLKTDLRDFEESFYAPPGTHPETPTLCSAVFPVCRRRAAAEGWSLIEGTATWAEPGGTINRATWERLRDEILGQIEAALPLDAVVLGLHGAMVAEGYEDCEGDLLARARALVGPDCVIGATLDPHSHLTMRRAAATDILVAFKEFPHVDFVDCAERCVDLVLRAARGEVRPHMSVADCRMIEVLPTSREPMRAFVERIKALERQAGFLSISVIHGFMAGDVPEMGTKIIVITDGDAAKGDALAGSLAQELFALRGRTRPDFLTAEQALDKALACEGQPVVIADVWDNPGGGVPGDSTVLLREALSRGLTSVAVGTIWDPMAVRTCLAAGLGARFALRFGAKMSDRAGEPLDAEVTVKAVARDAYQSFGASRVPLGDTVVIDVAGIDVVLNTNRAQAFDPSLFTNLGIDPAERKVLIVKSTNHFYDGFAGLAAAILYADVPGPYPSDPRTAGYRRVRGPIWPLDDDPHAADAA